MIANACAGCRDILHRAGDAGDVMARDVEWDKVGKDGGTDCTTDLCTPPC